MHTVHRKNWLLQVFESGRIIAKSQPWSKLGTGSSLLHNDMGRRQDEDPIAFSRLYGG